MKPVVILGTGLAGYTLAREIRRLNTELPLTLITADDGSAYSKPMLSNALTRGKTAAQLVSATAAQMAEQLDASIETRTTVVAIDREKKTVRTDHESWGYSRLVLALGADPIRLDIDGDGAADTLSVNDLGDYSRFRERLKDAHQVLILGAGLIGCEFANDLLNTGYSVTIVDPAAQPLGKLLPEQSAKHLLETLKAAGINWRLGTTAQGIKKGVNAYRVTLADGSKLEAHLVLSAVGLKARTHLAALAGISCNRGIQADRYLRTSDDDIFALGDCAEVGGLYLPFVMPIMHAARALAKTLSGQRTRVSYPAMPVVVKTPSCPVVVAPPPSGAQGQWRVETLEDTGTRARFVDQQLRLLGFALTGSAAAEKQKLTRQLPPVLA
jgi:rubredoxin-NAD+ reductase